MPVLVFDIILVISLIGSASATVFAADPVRASLLFVVLAGLATAVLRLPPEPAGVADQARAWMPSTGVDQPVTAVLLSYRVYDTWLEVVVVLVAVMVVLLVAQRPDVSDVVSPRRPHPLQARYVHLLAPLLVVVGIFLVSRGTHSVGGAFQGAAVLTGAALLVWLSGDASVASAAAPSGSQEPYP